MIMQTAMLLNGRRFSARYSGPKADLIYLGSEFCQNLLPGPAEFGRALKLFKKRVILVTPFMTDPFIRKAEAVIREYAAVDERLEIVANDLGLIHLVRQKYAAKVQLSLGRVLGHALKSSGCAFMTKFFAENGITRLEADSRELLDDYGRFPRLSRSYHIPYSYMGITRFCPWEKIWTGEKCGFTCLGGGKKLSSGLLPRPLHLINSGYFAPGIRPAGNWQIDRIVYQPPVHHPPR